MSRQRGVRRLDDDGGVEIVIGTGERDALADLAPQLRAVVDGTSDSDLATLVRDRLFPAAYPDDPERQAEYEELAGDELAQMHRDALDTFEATLAGGTTQRERWSVRLSGEEAEAWLAAINDGRLTLATAVGITDESCWDEGPDPEDPASVLLFYLGWLEEELVGALQHGLDAAG